MVYFYSLIKSKVRFLIIIPIIIILSVLSFSFGIQIFTDIQKYSKVNADGYSMIDLFSEEEELQEFFRDEHSLSKMKEMYQRCKTQWDSSYYIMTDQSIIVSDLPLPKKFAHGYGQIPEDDLIQTFVHSIQMNSSAIDGSSMNLLEGRFFEKEEYVYKDSTPVPVLVGYEYKDYLKINDTFEINYLGKPLMVKVVGILEEGAYSAKSQSFLLDLYMIMPALEFNQEPITKEEYSFQMKVYLGHTNAYVYSSSSVLGVQNRLDKICKEVDIKPYIMAGVAPIDIFHLGYAKSNLILFLILPIALLVLILVLFSYLTWRKLRNILPNLSINQKSDYFKLIVAVYLETLLWVIIAGILSLILSLTILSFLSINLWILFGSLLILWIFIPLVSIYKLFRMFRSHSSVPQRNA